MDWLDEYQKWKNSGWGYQPTTGSSSVTSPTTTAQSGTITSRQVDSDKYGGGGGGGGMSMGDMFTNLGDKIQNNSLKTIGMFTDMRNADRDRRRQAMLDAEAKREFDVGAAQSGRNANLNAMEFLANARTGAQGMANRRLPFKDALATLVR